MSNIKQLGQLARDDSGFPVGWKSAYLSVSGATGATIIKPTPGILHSITFNKPVATTVVSFCDSASDTSGTLGVITVPSSPQPVTLFYDVVTKNGIVIDMEIVPSDITISYV